ncbi:MAG TPA: DUF3168 domain-containing protein [Rhizomicrobium sp.]|jgi:hypothetical protein|nr:DUF3168 domain-containing protein [Rhizomicrobium sp.]
MIVAASLELQKALYGVITADAGVQAAMGVTTAATVLLYDKVPDTVMQAFAVGTAPTYITLGEGHERYDLPGESDDPDDNVEITNHVLVFHVWSQKVGLLEAKTIALAVRAAIVSAYNAKPPTLTLTTNRLLRIDPNSLVYDRLQDGFTSHAALTMTAQSQPRA